MISPKKVSKKIIMLGHFGVGKSSLVRQFVEQKFVEKYMTTIGVDMKRKVVEIGDTQLTMIIWDIEGGAVQAKLPKTYFMGASGIVYVFDLTRPSTWENIEEDLGFFKNLLPGAAIQVVGNKADLLEREELRLLSPQITFPYNFISSAKTGENVEKMFIELGLSMLK